MELDAAPYAPMADALLRDEWRSAFGAYDNVDVAFDRLLRAYREPGRYYHTIEHGLEVATTARTLAGGLDQASTDDLCLAAWAHDAVFEPRRGDSEEQSAMLAADVAQLLGFGDERAKVVAGLVLATTHTSPVLTPLEQMICDADLAVLAKPWQGYADDVANIRAEMGVADPGLWRRVRSKMLTFFEQRTSVYLLPEAVDRWEDTARANQRTERHLLGAASSR